MADEGKVKEILNKIQEGTFNSDDIIPYMEIFIDIARENEDIQYELEGWDRRMNFIIDGAKDFSLTIEDGNITLGDPLENADITFEFDADTATKVLTCELDATSAYMAGDLKITGPLPDAIKFRTIVELVREELEEYS